MSKATTLFDGWRGMAPDLPRDDMSRAQVWLMKDWIPRARGSQLEARKDWRYSTHGPLNGPVVVQKFISTYGLSHYLAATPTRVYDLDSLEAPDILVSATTGLGNPMASLFNLVAIPRNDGNVPVFLHYATGAANPTVQTPGAGVPAGKHVEAWNDYFAIANTASDPGRIHFYGLLGASGVTGVAWDTKSWLDTISDVTGLARTRTSLIAFHADSVERIRGGIPPSGTGTGDLWREPIMGLGGCTSPRSITYWNENVLFCDGRGAYITDGTTIKDLTNQAVSQAWQAAYTSTTKIAAGITGNYWVVSFTVSGSAVMLWVYDLLERWWLQFSNVPAISFVTTFDQREHLYGGTQDGKVIDVSRMWNVDDATANMVDENGVAVLPQLETAWYSMSKQEAVKRINQGLISMDLDEDAGFLRVYFSKRVQPTSSDWILGKEYREADQVGLIPADQNRKLRTFPVGREAPGFAFRLETGGQIRNLKLYDLSVEGPSPREDSYR